MTYGRRQQDFGRGNFYSISDFDRDKYDRCETDEFDNLLNQSRIMRIKFMRGYRGCMKRVENGTGFSSIDINCMEDVINDGQELLRFTGHMETMVHREIYLKIRSELVKKVSTLIHSRNKISYEG